LFSEENEVASGYRSATEQIAGVIWQEFKTRVTDYGIDIHRVALQDVKFPPDVYAAAIDAAQIAYLPIKAQREALERKLMLQAEADVIGAEAVATKEIAGNIPALAFDHVLSPLFMDLGRKRSLEVRQTEAAPPLVN
jgi:regulator of protease activity HflC (stomatin/prohibitin superfamily)